MNFSNDIMQNTENERVVENEDDLQYMADKVVQEESEELVFEETENDLDMVEDDEPKKTFTIMGFTLEQNQLYMLGALLIVVVFVLFKKEIMDFINGLGLFNTECKKNLY
tara:strand:- start:436 stop:765 length:330 start_codon:yes stop_codon:yes gene_type:complete